MSAKRLIVAITGASGAIHGVRLLEVLREIGGIETHLVVTPAGWLNIEQELQRRRPEIEALADAVHGVREIGATIASGSFATAGMVVAPCSMRTLAAIAHGLSDNLVTRAADVALKERRRLVLMVRETPLHKGHLELMARAADCGATILPPMPAFYHHPQTIMDIVHQSVGKALDQVGIEHQLFRRWTGEDRGELRNALRVAAS